MRINDFLYFSPNYKFEDIDLNDKELLIDAFEDRVKGFYLEPASILNAQKKAFATGILCVTLIDSLSRLHENQNNVGDRMAIWLINNIPEFNKDLAKNFYKNFRNGLVHEGRIKNGCQFSCETNRLVHQEEEIVVINVDLLLKRIYYVFDLYITQLRNDHDKFRVLKKQIEGDFSKDLKNSNDKKDLMF